ncbi:MAG: transporter substrate-binding domain-containing protein [Pseudomonadales bacterium]|nr:transporter substrate-binding domain-containing protein [Pseudomonadales bacterium]
MSSSITKPIVIFALYLMMLSNNSWSQNIKMVTTEWEPYYSSNLEAGGVVTAVVVAAFKKVGHETTINWYPWSRALKIVEYGGADVVMGAYYSEERTEKYYFSDPFFSIDVGLIALKNLGIDHYKSLKSLAPYTIGAVRGWVYTDEFDSANFLKKQLTVNQVMSIRMLFAGRIDMVVASIPVFIHETRHIPKHEIKETIVLKPLLDSRSLYLMFSKKNNNSLTLLEDFNRGLSEIRADGTLEKIISRYGL